MASQGLIFPAGATRYFANTAAALSLVPLATGLYYIVRPENGLKMLQYPSLSTGTYKDGALVNSLISMIGVRNVVGSITTLTLWNLGHYRAMGLIGFSGALLAAVDGFAAMVVGASSGVHLGAVPVALVLSSGILGWL
ncbi:Hypothetical protein D9617_16g014360 [Elsinoe fawcettii]|nr:Hypothetical protein D9617_16g014360 [Elsinoe fawcettii]